MRFSIDVGGTFTDLVVEDAAGRLSKFKSPTTPGDPVRGILDAFELAARAAGTDRRSLLSGGTVLAHATTRALNAVLTGTTARTAFLTTRGHPDVLLLREGGRLRYNQRGEYPAPYVPRSLTFEVPERIGSQGEVVTPLDEDRAVEIIRALAGQGMEAVAVCLLWSIVNPVHERRIGELLDEHLPGVPYTLSHRLNPTLREYRRASSTAIDASLKPIMQDYLGGLEARLRESGFGGRILIVTSAGGVLDAADVADAPIHVLKSGPSMAPVAGLHYAGLESEAASVLVADAGGTSYEISVARRGRIRWTLETWLGEEFIGHMTGFPSIDVRSIGAGGGSIAWTDEGGFLHVGPQSAGAEPGPACYGAGGLQPTVTDACLALGYIDPDYFLGGSIRLDAGAATRAIADQIGRPLGMEPLEAASAVIRIVTENMVQLIEDVAMTQGVDPRGSVLVGGGGAGGLNACAIGRRLGCDLVVIPEVGPVISTVGALLSDLTNDHVRIHPTTSDRFDFAGVATLLDELRTTCLAFVEGPGADSLERRIELFAQVRYPSEIWELEVPVDGDRISTPDDVERLRRDYHALHAEHFGTSDPGSPIVIVGWRGRARCRFREAGDRETALTAYPEGRGQNRRAAYFPGLGSIEIPVHRFEELGLGERLSGPAIVESAVTTIVVDPDTQAMRSKNGSLVIQTRNP